MLKDRLIDYTESIVKRATYTINGKVKEGTIGKIIKDTDNITFYLYIDDNEQGKNHKCEIIRCKRRFIGKQRL